MDKPRIVALLLAGLLLFFVRPTLGQGGDIVVEGADVVLDLAVNLAADLTGQTVEPRIIFEAFNVNRELELNSPVDLIDSSNVGPRLILQAANVNRGFELSYPAALLNDVTPPLITGIAGHGDENSYTITWSTAEFADSQVLYGQQPESYTWAEADPFYAKTHVITLTGLNPETEYYYRVRSTDRSGNHYESDELSFKAGNFLYLPLVVK